jgi:hypothetical protein
MRFNTNLIRGAALAAVIASAAALPARADIILETASYTGNDPGDYPVYGDATNGRFIGASFSVSQTTDITSIGVGFGDFGSGTIFAAIVSLDPSTGFPANTPADLGANALAHTVFAVPSSTTDFSTPLAATLAPGDYGIVFGSGVFGANGDGPISSGNDDIGSPSLFQFLSVVDPNWIAQSADGLRIVVEGTAVPEPMSLTLLGGALAGLALARRRTRG